MNQLETKPKNVKEAIEAGWMTAKEIYEAAGVDRRTWVNFLDAVRKATLQRTNSSCESNFTSRKCITGEQILVAKVISHLESVLQEPTILNTFTKT